MFLLIKIPVIAICNVKIILLLTIGSELRKQLEDWLNAADLSHGPARAIIAPSVINYII